MYLFESVRIYVRNSVQSKIQGALIAIPKQQQQYKNSTTHTHMQIQIYINNIA